MNEQELKAFFTQIANECLDIETLETRNRDRLDFHDVSVWGVRQALQKAYEAGQKSREQAPMDHGIKLMTPKLAALQGK